MGANNVAKKNGQLLNSPRPTMIQETEYDTRAVLITHLFEDEVKQNFLNTSIATTIRVTTYVIVV